MLHFARKKLATQCIAKFNVMHTWGNAQEVIQSQ